MPEIAHRFDATNDFAGVLNDDLFAFMQARYWVLVFSAPPPGTPAGSLVSGAARWDSWIYYPDEPMPVPNRQMHWRRPTWDECLDFIRLPVAHPDLVDAARVRTAEHGRAYGCRWEWTDPIIALSGHPGQRIPRRLS